MLMPKLNEKRKSQRSKLTGLLPGKFVTESDLKNFSCRPVDVSSNGLGILCSQHLETNTILILILKDSSIYFKVIWRQPDYGKKSMFRYGLQNLNNKINIEEVFRETGCLKPL